MDKVKNFRVELKELLTKHSARIYKDSYTDYMWNGEDEEGYSVEEFKVDIDGKTYDLDEVL